MTSSRAAVALAAACRSAGLRFKSIAVVRSLASNLQTLDCDVRWHPTDEREEMPTFVDQLSQRPGTVELVWRPTSSEKP